MKHQTVEELLTSYPDDYFQLMTPCGFVDLTPSETEKLLRGEATMAHPGVSGCQMPVEAQELLEMEVLKKRRSWLLVCADRPPTAENGAGFAGAADVVIGGGEHGPIPI